MSEQLDLRGLSCPIPLLKTRDALANTDFVKVIVDEIPPRENIIKFAKSQNYKVECHPDGGDFIISITK